MSYIFETNRLGVRALKMNDFESFNEMQSNKQVMQFVRGRPMTYQENKEELPQLIEKYNDAKNDFFIYAVERKTDKNFVGTVALVKDDANDDEIGYRFIEKFWGNGYGYEVAEGLVTYCKKMGIPKLVAYVVNENKASMKIIIKLGFSFVKEGICKELNLPERKFELVL